MFHLHNSRREIITISLVYSIKGHSKLFTFLHEIRITLLGGIKLLVPLLLKGLSSFLFSTNLFLLFLFSFHGFTFSIDYVLCHITDVGRIEFTERILLRAVFIQVSGLRPFVLLLISGRCVYFRSLFLRFRFILLVDQFFEFSL